MVHQFTRQTTSHFLLVLYDNCPSLTRLYDLNHSFQSSMTTKTVAAM